MRPALDQGGRDTVEVLENGYYMNCDVQPEGASKSHARVGVVFPSRRLHTIFDCDWSSDVCSSDLEVASDGTYALERALAGPFDVIICDLRMPHLSGREMYTKLARQDPRVAERIIFATGDTVRGDTLQFLEALGRPYLHKPFTLAELRAALGHAAKQPA